jgi:NAD-dependent SIR2 family protein deacetylase
MEKHKKSFHQLTNLPQCHICNKRFNKSYSLRQHIFQQHGVILDIDKKNLVTCTYCNKQYLYLNMLRKHMEQHRQKVYTCKYCQADFNSPNIMVDHQVQQHQQQSFECKTCGRKFIASCDLRMHERSHWTNNLRQFKCDICKKSFKRRQDVLKHMRTHLPPKKTLRCKYCGKCLVNENYLRSHIALFHEEHKEELEEKKSSAQAAAAPAPILVAAAAPAPVPQNYPYECNVCKFTFINIRDIALHVHIEHLPKNKNANSINWYRDFVGKPVVKNYDQLFNNKER